MLKIETMCASIFKLYICMGCANDTPAFAKGRRKNLRENFGAGENSGNRKKWAKEQ